MSAIGIVGETTSMYANRPRSCRRNDLDVCESTCMRNDRHPTITPGTSFPTLSEQCVGSLTSHTSTVRRSLRFYRPYPRRLESLTI